MITLEDYNLQFDLESNKYLRDIFISKAILSLLIYEGCDVSKYN